MDKIMTPPLTKTRTSKKTKQREDLIAAMLRLPTLQKAAAAAGISDATAWRIRRTPEFELEWSATRRDAYSHGMARLQHGCANAASLLLMMVNDSNCPPSVRVQSASLVIACSKNALVAENLEQRILLLEQESRQQ